MRNDISSRTKYYIRLVFEELTYNILKPVLDHVPVLIRIEHSDQGDITEVTALYGGDRFDPTESEDDFSYKVLKSTVSSFAYEYDAEAEHTNTIKIGI